MKETVFTSAVLTLMIFSQCKEEDNNEDWAAAVAGIYNGQIWSGGLGDDCVFTITRISDKLFSLQVEGTPISHCLDSVSMIDPDSFTIGEKDACLSGKAVTGNGDFTELNGTHFAFVLYYADSINYDGFGSR